MNPASSIFKQHLQETRVKGLLKEVDRLCTRAWTLYDADFRVPIAKIS